MNKLQEIRNIIIVDQITSKDEELILETAPDSLAGMYPKCQIVANNVEYKEDLKLLLFDIIAIEGRSLEAATIRGISLIKQQNVKFGILLKDIHIMSYCNMIIIQPNWRKISIEVPTMYLNPKTNKHHG